MDRISFEAFVLAGGKSSRMGTDKGLMDFQGKKMIEHVLASLKSSSRISIITGNDAYGQFGYRICSDIYNNCGPLGGIHSALYNSTSGWNLVVSCDLPFVTAEFCEFLVRNINDTFADAIVPVHDKHVEPLCALYNKACLPELEKMILKKEFRMHTVLENLNTIYVEVPGEFDSSVLFRNMNTTTDISQ